MNLRSIFLFGAGRTPRSHPFGLSKTGQLSATAARTGAADGTPSPSGTSGGPDVAQVSTLARDSSQIRRVIDQAPVPASGRLASLAAAVQGGGYSPDVGLLAQRLFPVLVGT